MRKGLRKELDDVFEAAIEMLGAGDPREIAPETIRLRALHQEVLARLDGDTSGDWRFPEDFAPRRVCGRCKKTGHNVRTCPDPPSIDVDVSDL